MAREKPAYRDNLEFLLERSEGKMILNISEVCRICGISYRTSKQLFPFNDMNLISLPTLARAMS